MAKRIGPCMERVARMASREGGITRIDAASKVAPHGALGYGYATVNRAIEAGIVVPMVATEPGRRGVILTTLDY